jgi:hypothetical protein
MMDINFLSMIKRYIIHGCATAGAQGNIARKLLEASNIK